MSEIDEKYKLSGTCLGCMRVTWLCRRYRRCSRYNTKPQRGFVSRPTGFVRLTPLQADAAGSNHGDGPEQTAAPLKPGS